MEAVAESSGGASSSMPGSNRKSETVLHVKLLVGEARSGKTLRLVREYAERLRTGAHCLWIAPNRAAARAVREAIVQLADRAVLAPGVGTFSDLAESLIRRSPRRLRKLSPIEQRRILMNAVREALEAGRVDYFAAVAESPGFLSTLSLAIAEWKRRDVWPDKIAAAQNARQRELAEIYGRYQRLLQNRESIGAGSIDAELYDPEGLFWAARDYVKRAAAEFAGLQLVVVDGFTDFTAAQRDILEVLAERVEQMIASSTIEPACLADTETASPRCHLFAKPMETCRWLTSLGASCETQPFNPSTSPAIDHLRQHLFRDYHAQPTPTRDVVESAERIHIVAASSVQTELEETARRIKSLLRSGASPGDVVITARRLPHSANRLRQVCDDFGLPAFIESPRLLSEAPLVRTLLRLLRLHAEDWPAPTLLAVVGDETIRAFNNAKAFSAGDNNLRKPNASAVDVRAAVELGVRTAATPRGRREIIAGVKSLAEREVSLAGPSDDADKLDVPADRGSRGKEQPYLVALKGLELMEQTLSSLPEEGDIDDWIAAIEGLANQLGLGDSSTTIKGTVDWLQVKHCLRATATADAACGRGGERYTVAQVLEICSTAAKQVAQRNPFDDVGRVRFVTAETARVLDAEHLFLVGLTEQSFSAANAPEDFDADRFDLATSAVDSDKSADGAQADEMLLFYQLVSRPTQSLTLSYPALDDKGQPLSPSPLLAELERCLAGCNVARFEMPLGQPTWSKNSELATTERRQAAVDAALDGDVGPLASLHAPPRDELSAPSGVDCGVGAHTKISLSDSILDGLSAVANRGRSDGFGRFEGVLADPRAAKRLAERFGGSHYWSPSQLERYAECPFLFFVEHVLQIQPTPEFGLEEDVRRRGSLLHETLARMHRQLIAKTNVDVQAGFSLVIEEFRRAAAEVFGAGPSGGLARALRDIQRRQVEAWGEQLGEQFRQYAAQWSDWDEPPTPAFFEVQFGPGSGGSDASVDDQVSCSEPFDLPIGEEVIHLTGQIDRIDVGRFGGAEAFNVIDYKSSARSLSYDKIADGQQLQLPLYAMAAEQHVLAKRGAAAVSAGYWNVRDKGYSKPSKKGGQLRARQLDEDGLALTEHWNKLQTEMLERIRQIVAGVRRGDFPVFNEDDDCTSRCDLRTICRIGQIRSMGKKWIPDADGEES